MDKKSLIAILFLVNLNLSAFEIVTGLKTFSGAGGGYTNTSGTYFPSYDTSNLLLQIGHYKNSDKEGWGFGWHLGGSYAYDESKWYYGSNFEFGMAIGYTLLKDLNLKGEFGLGLNFINVNNATIAPYVGAAIDYAIVEHYLVGLSFRKYKGIADTNKPSSDSYDYSPTATTVYLGYRF